MSKRPPAIETIDDFLEARTDYPDEAYRSLRMGVLREARQYIEALEEQVDALEDLVEPKLKTSTELVEIIKHAITVLASKETS